MAKQYEIALSEIMYELAEKEKKGLPGWVAPTATAAGVIGGAALGHKFLAKPAAEALKKARIEGVSKIANEPLLKEGKDAYEVLKQQRAASQRIHSLYSGAEKASKYAVPAATGIAGGAALGVPTAMMSRKKKE